MIMYAGLFLWSLVRVLAFFVIAVVVAVISRSNEAGLDRIYAVIVTALVMGLLFFIFYLL